MSFRVDKAWRQRCSQRFRNVLATGPEGFGGSRCWGTYPKNQAQHDGDKIENYTC